MDVELSGHYGYRRIIRTMTPMALMMAVVSIYSIVDGYFISNYAGSDAFAGMNLIWPAIALVGSLGMMIGAGGSALVSKTFGEGDPQRANGIFSMLMVLNIVTGVVLGAVLTAVMPSLVRFLGSDENMLPYAVSYGRILSAALPLYMLQVAFQPFFMVAERPHWGTILSIVCGLTNIVFDAWFVAGMGWGLNGAAAATVLALGVGGLVPLFLFSSRGNKTQLKMLRSRMEPGAIIQACSNGLSEFVGNVALNVVGICYNWQLMRLIGADGVSAYGIIMYIGFTFASIFIGYNMGISQVISYNFGNGNKTELRSLLRKSVVIICCTGAVMCLCAEASAGWVAGIFTSDTESLRALSEKAIRIYMLSFSICGLNMFASAWFTALNNGLVSALAAFARTMVFELLSVFTLPALMGLDGIWNAVNVAEILSLAVSAALVWGYRKRYL